MRRALALYGLVIGVIFAPFLLTGKVFVPGDFLAFIYPWRAYLSGFPHNVELFDVTTFFYPQDVFYNEALKRGQFPFWNPWIFSGHPIVASGQSGFLYPPRLVLHGLFSPGVAKTWIQLIHLFLAGLSMRWFLTLRGFSALPATLGGLVWMGNSFTTSWLEFEHVPIAAFYLPLMLGSLDRATQGDRRWWLALSMAGALTLHSGHLQVNLYTGAILLAYAAYRLGRSRNLSHLLYFALSGLLTLGLAAPTVLGFLELLQNSQRVPLDPGANAASLPSLALSLLNPDLWGNPTKGFLINRCRANLIYPEFACFVGLAPLALAVIARGPRASALKAVSLLCLILAAAPFSLSLPLLGRFIPGRILHVLMFCLSCLACLGAEQWLREDRIKELMRRCLVLLGGLWFALLGIILYLTLEPSHLMQWQSQNPQLVKLPPSGVSEETFLQAFRQTYLLNPQIWLTTLGLAGLWLVRRRAEWFLVLTACELALFAAFFNTSVPPAGLFPSTPEIKALQQSQGRVVGLGAANYNLLVPYHLSLVNGYESLVPNRYATGLRQAEPETPLPMRSLAFRRTDRPILDALSLDHAILPPGQELQAEGWEQVFSGNGGTVYRNSQAIPRAILLGQVRPLRDLQELQAFNPSQEAFVSLAPPPDLKPGGGSVRWLEDTPNRLSLAVECDSTQLLLLTDSYDEGWKVEVNGSEAPLFAANLVSRGVYLTAGRHTVTYSFEPHYLRLGFALASGSFVVLVMLMILWSLAPRGTNR